VSPLQLLAPPARALSPSEFYQRWQALANRTCIAASPKDPSPLGMQHLLAAIEAAGLGCVMKAVVPVAGGVHAAFHGAAWSGESIACIVTSAASHAASGPPLLHLHFGSEAADVVVHIQGHEGELLSQLTGGLALPVGGGTHAAGYVGGEIAAVAESGGAAETEDPASRRISTFSFLRSAAARREEVHEGVGVDDEDSGSTIQLEREAEARRETEALGAAAVSQWQRLQAFR